MESNKLISILQELISLPQETEWVEFKHNNENPKEIGEYISALSNSATLHRQNFGYIVWGIEDNTHQVIGTKFKPKQAKFGSQELENWLLGLISPKINIIIHEFIYQNKNIVLFEIPCATHQPVSFKGIKYIRVGSYKKQLKKHPEKERVLWSLFSYRTFETRITLENITADEVLAKINYPSYFELTSQNLPDNKQGILERLADEKLITIKPSNYYDITNLGAILFAKKLNDFDRLGRKAIRVIIYKDKGRLFPQRERVFEKGYAVSYKELKDMDKSDRIRACYQHACLRYVVFREQMTNESLRKRFEIDDKNYSMASRIIADTINGNFSISQGKIPKNSP